MNVYKLTRNDDGSVKVETMLTAEEMQFMMEFALANLMAMGYAPNSVAAYIEANKEEFEKQQQEAVLNAIPKDQMGEA